MNFFFKRTFLQSLSLYSIAIIGEAPNAEAFIDKASDIFLVGVEENVNWLGLDLFTILNFLEDNGVAGNGVDGSEDKLKFEELGVGVDGPFDAKDELIAEGAWFSHQYSLCYYRTKKLWFFNSFGIHINRDILLEPITKNYFWVFASFICLQFLTKCCN